VKLGADEDRSGIVALAGRKQDVLKTILNRFTGVGIHGLEICRWVSLGDADD
jgi:hypothetical protein